MARYIDLEILERRIKKYVKPEIPEEKAFVEWCKDECIRQAYAMPTADVVPKSEVDGLEYKLAGVMHSVDKWLEGDEMEKDEVNRAITMREKTLRLIENANTDAAKWYHEYHGIKDELKQEKMYHRETEKLADKYCAELQTCKTEVAREIFEEIDVTLSEHYGKASEKADSKLLEPLRQAQRFVINEIYDDLAELKKKYTKENTENENQN